MSFSDTVFIFFLALIVFGPKKLPEMARQAGRLLAELRRASNEFKSQIETEIAHMEVQKDAQKKAEAAPIPSSPGTVASLSVNPAVGETIPHHATPAATLASPTADAGATAASAAPVSSTAPSEPSIDSPPQASHV